MRSAVPSRPFVESALSDHAHEVLVGPALTSRSYSGLTATPTASGLRCCPSRPYWLRDIFRLEYTGNIILSASVALGSLLLSNAATHLTAGAGLRHPGGYRHA